MWPAGSILTQSLLVDLGLTFAVAVAATTAFVLALLAYETILSYDVGLLTCSRLLPLLMPRALSYTISASWLFAICVVYGARAATNELVALASLGISPLRMFVMPLTIAAGLALPTSWLMDIGDSWAKDRIQEVALASAVDNAYHRLRSSRSFCGNHVSIAVQDVEGRQLVRPLVSYTPPDEHQAIIGTAESGRLSYDSASRQIRVVLQDGSVSFADRTALHFSDTFVIRLALSDAGRKPARHLSFRQLPEAIAAQAETVRTLEQQARAMEEPQRSVTDADPALGERLDRARYGLFRLRMFWHRCLSQGLCCLSFTAFGWPLAVRLRCKDAVTTFFLCFLPVLFWFYPAEIVCAKSGLFPSYSLWSCHAVLILAGLFLLRKL